MTVGSKKISYDASLNMLLSHRCNFACHYCISKTQLNKLKNDSINIPRFLKVLEDTGKTFHLNFSGWGDPFAIPNLVEASEALTKKHYVSLITHLTDPKVKEFAKEINPDRVPQIIASFHIEELERLNLMDLYFENLSLLKSKGFHTISMEVAYPTLFDKIDKYKNKFAELGIFLSFNSFWGSYNNKEYPESYTKKQKRKIDSQTKVFMTMNTACAAGYSVGAVMPNGDVMVCGLIKKKIGNIYKKIEFSKELTICPRKKCPCPSSVSEPDLFGQALKEVGLLNQKLSFKLYKMHKYMFLHKRNIQCKITGKYNG